MRLGKPGAETVQKAGPEGGLFIWVTRPGDHVDTREILKRAVAEHNVGYVPGCPFFRNPEDGRNALRLNFSSQSPERIEAGIRGLGQLLAEYC